MNETKQHPGRLTWNLERMACDRNFLFQGVIFRFHVKLWQGIKIGLPKRNVVFQLSCFRGYVKLWQGIPQDPWDDCIFTIIYIHEKPTKSQVHVGKFTIHWSNGYGWYLQGGTFAYNKIHVYPVVLDISFLGRTSWQMPHLCGRPLADRICWKYDVKQAKVKVPLDVTKDTWRAWCKKAARTMSEQKSPIAIAWFSCPDWMSIS